MRLAAFALVSAVLFAGCAGSSAGSDGAAPTIAAPTFDAATGALSGVVTDDSLVPIKGALVGLVARHVQAATDKDGQFQFGNLPPGNDQLQVEAIGYTSALTKVHVDAGKENSVSVRLQIVPVIEPYQVTQIKSGKIFCGLAWRVPHPPPVPDQSSAFAACGAVYNTPLSNLDSFVVDFDLSSNNISRVRTLVLQTKWTPTQAFGSGLDVLWEIHQNITATYGFTEPLRQLVEVAGPTPLRTSVNESVISDNATHYKPPPQFCKPDGPCKFWGRVFPYASTFGPSAPADLTVYSDQTYTHYVTEFYGDPAPDGFSALPDS